MTKKHLGVLILLLALYSFGSAWSPDAGHAMAAWEPPMESNPDWPLAPRWVPGEPGKMPAYRWPAGFKLSTKITIEVPDIPAKIQKVSPPIKKQPGKGLFPSLFGSIASNAGKTA